MSKALLSGDEAIARGAWEAGVKVAAAYPGTPSTQILENLVKYPDVYSEWSTNEKVALEVALGAALSGVRSLCAMKHVGLNVAADALFSSAYIGVRAGMVIVSADDPGLHSSQNEQDNRFYGLSAKVPVLCPADSEEAKEYTKLAFEISEEFDIPVILRITTRIAHSKTIVNLGDRRDIRKGTYIKDITKTNLLPQFAKGRHYSLEERLRRLKEYSNTTPINKIIPGKKSLGIIADGVAYQYAREVFPNASFLKLGMVYPFPEQLVREFAQNKNKIYVIEETDPFLELLARSCGIKVIGKTALPLVDELNPRIVRNAFRRRKINFEPEKDLPPRPPALCPGCPHSGLFYLLQRKDLVISGDIGCYTLGTYPPHNAMDSCVCMGASITLAHGIDKALKGEKKVVSVIGDSTFFHMGVTGLINAVYNKSKQILIILDNRTTGMTGHQEHPGTGRTLMGEETTAIRPEDIARACGIKEIYVIDPYEIKENRALFSELLKKDELVVLVSRRACALLGGRKPPLQIILDKCTGCKMCLRIGCPAITFSEGHAVINTSLCVGCEMCLKLCPSEAIVKTES
ncbi:MAG: indolepyruvate ferredoxin oxidoreductase subunit alpha [candidate division WOR-3 bacterium]|nr:indolepyruvate ferredoxin oxidoreductase subunit alpha [candidate division WOR-3 bacterium]MCX7757734.1 indolepyruvate ferredoxin oxidoreductase subunit alpha [candidate division WOR-3 bacterium]MDW7988153.1 indolepyruvate ferredoxin oxidoreductase subunit alpha [candidate division WOR-3 bacterium]